VVLRIGCMGIISVFCDRVGSMIEELTLKSSNSVGTASAFASALDPSPQLLLLAFDVLVYQPAGPFQLYLGPVQHAFD